MQRKIPEWPTYQLGKHEYDPANLLSATLDANPSLVLLRLP